MDGRVLGFCDLANRVDHVVKKLLDELPLGPGVLIADPSPSLPLEGIRVASGRCSTAAFLRSPGSGNGRSSTTGVGLRVSGSKRVCSVQPLVVTCAESAPTQFSV